MKSANRKKLATLEKLYRADLAASSEHTSRTLQSLSHGPIEVWNYIECQRQNAEHDGNDFLAHFECGLASESEEVQAFFLSHGLRF